VARKKTLDGGLLVLALVIGGLVSIWNQYGDLLLVIGGIGLVVWLVRQALSLSDSGHSSTVDRATLESHVARMSISTPGSRKRSLSTQSTDGDRYWIGVEQGGDLGGWIYAGTGLASVDGERPEPALIDLELPLDASGPDCTFRALDYWPSYAGASPRARAAYQDWLRTGRKNPDADLGYVFLYFYGLERRVLHDTKTSSAARGETPLLQSEIERLLTIYTASGSFQSYAGSLLDLLRANSVKSGLYRESPPPLRGSGELTFEHRLALAQCAADGSALPAEWAHVWFLGDPTTTLRTPARRCPEEFRRLFLLAYRETFDPGMSLPRNRTKLKLERRPASSTFGYRHCEDTVTLDLPDVSVLTGPVKKLQALADTCCDRLDPYSRFIRNDRSLAETFDALAELPLVLWPEASRRPLEDARETIERSGEPVTLPFERLRASLPKWEETNRRKLRALYRVLGEAGLGMEPDVRFGGDVPTADSAVVLFLVPAAATAVAPSPRYLAAALTAQLAVAVALADGSFSAAEKSQLARHLQEGLGLNEAERWRLQARLQLLLLVPPKLTGLKSRIDKLLASERETIGNFLVEVALAESDVGPEEVKALEKTYRLLGLDPKLVYSRIHVAATEPVTVRPALAAEVGYRIPRRLDADQGAGVRLDPGKVAALQADSERVALLLGSIFAPDTPDRDPDPAPPPLDADPAEPQMPGFFGLDADDSALVRTLLTRSQWSREELEELAADRGLMLDGALERLNDASFEKYDKALLEGEDPVEVSQEIAREIQR